MRMSMSKEGSPYSLIDHLDIGIIVSETEHVESLRLAAQAQVLCSMRSPRYRQRRTATSCANGDYQVTIIRMIRMWNDSRTTALTQESAMPLSIKSVVSLSWFPLEKSVKASARRGS